MGNCLKTCFGSAKKRTDYFSGRFNNSSIDIEFENLIEDDDVQRSHEVLTDDERNLLQNRRYTDLVQEQQKIDAKLDKELELEEENARLEEEAYNAARAEASRAAKKARLLEMEKQRNKTQQGNNGSAKAWLGEDAGDWEIATEDDFEAFLDTVKAKSETVRASVASMLNTTSTTTTNQAVAKQPTSPTPSSSSPVAPASAHTSVQSVKPHSPSPSPVTQSRNPSSKTSVMTTSFTTPTAPTTSPSVNKPDTPSPQFNSLRTQGGKLGLSSTESSGPKTQGLVNGAGQADGAGLVDGAGQEQDSSKSMTQGEGQNDEEKGTEGSGKMSYYIKQGSKSSNHHQDDDDSDVEWEADFVSADSPSEPITITPQSSPAKLPIVGSSNSTTIPSHHHPIKTGLPSNSRTNGSTLTNGQLPYKHDVEKEIETSSNDDKMISNGRTDAAATAAVKPKKTLDIDIDKFLEELDFDT